MKVSAFFKILNRKIEKYNKMASNPFTEPQSVVIVWIEEDNNTEDFFKEDINDSFS